VSALSERDRITIQAALDESVWLLGFVMEALPVLRERMAYWERAGFPGSSIPEALVIGNGHDVEPGGDELEKRMRTDIAWLKRQTKWLEDKSRDFALDMRRCVDRYARTERPKDEEKLAPCKNPPCDNQVRVRVERTCARCRWHKSKYGLAWPKRRTVPQTADSP
jgi:hypothetical protein